MIGPQAAAKLDPMGLETSLGVPFSLHSDSPITSARPLWLAQQAITRRTWQYPDLKKTYVLGPDQAATVDQAMRGITIEAARDHELDSLIGSIEVGKVADFVHLKSSPYKTAPDQIGAIKVLTTYLGGRATK
jgi:predicted amidohydrolase YtcJ